ncbi:hypothetical protein FQA39_LY01828 [Lamprigera yunnana]|nr:hypothetical protein FQA39_LY01828 [Lamprigera yunnana]
MMDNVQQDETTYQVEPTRRTFLNVLTDNLKQANRLNYLHRLIYIGQHDFPPKKGFGVGLGEVMKQTIEAVNNDYHDEPLTGLLLSYPKYFCHLIEGSEDSIVKHLLLLTGNDNAQSHLQRMKVLVCHHHINQRFAVSWKAITGKPTTLLGQLDPNQIDLGRSYIYIYNCVKKMYILAYAQKMNVIGSVGVDAFPEFGLIEFLLSTEHTMDLYDYINLYGVYPPDDGLKDLVWPGTMDFIPFNIFETPVDPVTDLPNAEVSQEPTENIE